MRSIEILAPAGGPDCLEPAVRCGADAVYLGASRFSARGNAGNFHEEALRGAVAYCHARGVKVYLAFNTLLRDREWPEALALAEFACALGVDAAIVQDLGLAQMIRRAAPGLRLHASTQMSIHTPAGARLLAEQGFSRVVLARELSFEEIAAIAEQSPIELEVFVHGALCMSVSGQCYFSAMLGGRSGNRGLCAQPCRLPFSAPGGTGYDLSLKDLSAIGMIAELAKIGVASAKIEGRMKRPEYVAAAVTACRHAADGTPPPEGLEEALRTVFSRTGFTNGYLEAKRGRAMFGVREKEDAQVFARSLGFLHGLYRTERQRVGVDFSLTVEKGRPANLQARDAGGREAAALGPVPEEALNRPLTPALCEQHLRKTGGTPFYAREVDCRVGEGLSLPLSALGALRREALDSLLALRGQGEPVAFNPPQPAIVKSRRAGTPELRAHFADAARVPAETEGIALVYVPLATPPAALRALLGRGLRVGVELPRGLFGLESSVREALSRAVDAGVRDAYVGNLGAIPLVLEAGLCAHGGFSLNVMNTNTLQALETMGLCDAELSIELTAAQARSVGGALPRGLVAYGRIPLMLARNCPAANGGGCAACGGKGRVTDRRGAEFPILCGGGCSEILNSLPLSMLDKQRELAGMDFLSLRFTVESSVEIGETLAAARKGEAPKMACTRGLYQRGVL